MLNPGFLWQRLNVLMLTTSCWVPVTWSFLQLLTTGLFLEFSQKLRTHQVFSVKVNSKCAQFFHWRNLFLGLNPWSPYSESMFTNSPERESNLSTLIQLKKKVITKKSPLIFPGFLLRKIELMPEIRSKMENNGNIKQIQHHLWSGPWINVLPSDFEKKINNYILMCSERGKGRKDQNVWYSKKGWY